MPNRQSYTTSDSRIWLQNKTDTSEMRLWLGGATNRVCGGSAACGWERGGSPARCGRLHSAGGQGLAGAGCSGDDTTPEDWERCCSMWCQSRLTQCTDTWNNLSVLGWLNHHVYITWHRVCNSFSFCCPCHQGWGWPWTYMVTVIFSSFSLLLSHCSVDQNGNTLKWRQTKMATRQQLFLQFLTRLHADRQNYTTHCQSFPATGTEVNCICSGKIQCYNPCFLVHDLCLDNHACQVAGLIKGTEKNVLHPFW